MDQYNVRYRRMTRNQWNLPRSISSFDCGPDVVLFSENTGDLYLLNETAAYIWGELKTGLTPSAVCDAIVASTHAPPDRVAHDIRTLIGEWDRWAALGSSRTRGTADEDLRKPSATAQYAIGSFEGVYCALNFTFKVRAQHRDDFEIVTALFGHLSVEPNTTATVFDIVRGPQRSWRLIRNARLLGECDSLAGLAPLLHAEVLLSAYEGLDCLAALHAAVVADGERAILMPAPSGSGKSTLTAALVAAGYRYCTDDLAILTPPPVRIRAAPLSIGLKEGSWGPLARKLPLLREQSVHVRSDGRPIRYFVPPDDQLAPRNESYSTRVILFPRYEDDAEPSCRRIRPGDALLRLTQAGYDARLSSSVVAALTGWLADLPAYELRYSDLDEAVSAVKEIT